MNIQFSYKSGSKILRSKFISNPQLNSEILMAKTINKDRNYILLNPNRVLKRNNLNNFYNLIKQRSLEIQLLI